MLHDGVKADVFHLVLIGHDGLWSNYSVVLGANSPLNELVGLSHARVDAAIKVDNTERPRELVARAGHPVVVIVDVLYFIVGYFTHAPAVFLSVVSIFVVLALQDATECLPSAVVRMVAVAALNIENERQRPLKVWVGRAHFG